MRLTFAAAGLALVVGLSGCGSKSYEDQATSAVSDLTSAINAYNAAPSASLGDLGAACRLALDKLPAESDELSISAPERDRQLDQALHAAYREARAGFSDCAAAAAAKSYVQMVQADSEISAANQALANLRQLDR